jgi:hypothetical protein
VIIPPRRAGRESGHDIQKTSDRIASMCDVIRLQAARGIQK